MDNETDNTDPNTAQIAAPIAVMLLAARDGLGMSQRQLSARSGVAQAQISRIEAGLVDLRLSSLMALGHALGVELVLVPRAVVPAVRALVRTQGAGGKGAADLFDGPVSVDSLPAYSLDED